MLFTKGIGIVGIILKDDAPRQNTNEPFVAYPPILSVIYPPITNPKVGEVRHTIAKQYKRFFSSSTPKPTSI